MCRAPRTAPRSHLRLQPGPLPQPLAALRAVRRDDALGGLGDFAILGSADRHMAMGLVGKAELSMPGGIHPAYRDQVLGWQGLAEVHLRRNVNYVPGLITHWWHGKKKDRGYQDRWQVLTRWRYDPATDIRRTG